MGKEADGRKGGPTHVYIYIYIYEDASSTIPKLLLTRHMHTCSWFELNPCHGCYIHENSTDKISCRFQQKRSRQEAEAGFPVTTLGSTF